ncbi:MAG: hypothetical protein C0505_06730 [Leptothrix sp. (in: Bacteria)]|nr:hypothetical protein [Leptothrix sp. (in: b-proteobacteria)]
MCAVSALNVAAWLLSAIALQRRQAGLHPDALVISRVQLLLSAGYVLGCAYRSALPVFDVQRQVLFDTWYSSVIVGRSVATVAELCFVAQWALLLRAASDLADHRLGQIVARLLVPAIVLAELCSWHAVLTTSNLGHVFEESIWGLCAAALVISLVGLWPKCDSRQRPFLLFCGLAGTAYVVFMFGVDVPMYWARWIADEAHGRAYFSLPQGLIDASARWVVSHRWSDWESEVVWMTAYFSVAVWLSIGLVHVPALATAGPAPGIRAA